MHGGFSASEARGPLLDVRDVHFAYDGADEVLRGVSFSVEPGELMVLLGPNGAGKSTLLNCVMNLVTPQRGSIDLAGGPVAAMDHRSVARLVAYVPQTVNVAFAYSVRDYVAMGRAPFLKMYEAPGPRDLELVDAALERLGIAGLAPRAYTGLSGGQRQLANVARALVQQPRLLLFDEPTSALDYGNQVKVLHLVEELSHDGYAIVMTTHNPDHPILLGSTVALLDRTGTLRKGSVDQIMQEDVLDEVYRCPLLIRHVEDAGRRVCMTPRFG